MTEFKHVIWSNRDLDYEDWRKELEEEFPDRTETERISLMYEINDDYLEDDRINLDIKLDNPIIVIADIGRWNGRFSGCREIASGNIADCLYTDMDYATWYVDKNGDLRCDAVHHDGINHYLYREYKPDISEIQKENFREKVFSGTITREDITKKTRRLGDEIAKVYGFRIPKQMPDKER